MRAVHPTPSEDRVRVGARLRASRQAQGITIAQLATASKLTNGFISRIERDETSPSVATLVAICQVLSLPIGSLFESAATAVISLADAPFINMGGHGAVERMITPREQAMVQVLHSTLAPGADGGEDLYMINCDVEVLHVINGAVSVRFSGKTLNLVSGDTLTFEGRELHSWHNIGDSTAELLWVLVPAAWSGSR